jgi:hypothetical protein
VPSPTIPPLPSLDPPSTDSPVIAAAGDIACDPNDSSFNGGQGTDDECHQKHTSDLLVAGDYDRVLPLGDIQYDNATYEKFLASYDKSWGRVKNITAPIPGNHEYKTSGAAGYYKYFGAAAKGPNGYYSYDLGEWHVVALNSECSKVGGCGEGSPQHEWLEDDLADSEADCTLAYWHRPRLTAT